MSTTQRVVRKQLAGAEDLLQGVGTVTQTRGTGTYPIHKLDVPIPTYDIAEMQASSAEFMRLYGTDTAYTDYRRNPDGTIGIPSNLGGVWEPMRSSEYLVCGNFATGAYVFSSDCIVVLDQESYNWQGSVPKVVAAGSTPATSGGISSTAWVDRTDLTLRGELENEKSNFVNIKSYDYLNDPTTAFYSALSDSGYIDLMGVDITVTVTSQTAINKDVYIKNGTIRFVAPGLTRVFSLQSCNLFRFEHCNLYGNSNGSINDSFDTTSGTYSLAQAQLLSDGSVANVEFDHCYVYGMIVLDDNKYKQGATERYFVDGGYARKCKFEHIPGHAFAFSMWKNFTIEKNKFKDIGALCADFSTATTDCSFVDNDIDNASGIAKTQNHYSYNSGNIPIRNKINRNRAINLTGGTSSNVAIVKASGYKTEILENDIECAGTTAVESFELYGSTKCKGNTVKRTTNLTRSFVTTITDANLVTAYGKQVYEITDNTCDGALYFYRGQNTSASKVKCNRNNIKNAQRLFFAEASFNAPNMELNFNDVDTSAYAINPVQMSNSITALDGFSMVGNTITGQGVLYLVGANRGKLTANTLINTVGTSMLALINTTSISVVGNSGNYSWGTTSGQVIIEHNTVY